VQPRHAHLQVREDGAQHAAQQVRVATRTLERLPSLSWHDQLAPLDVPVHSVLRTMPVPGDAEEANQQQ
jgi:hypothetical protein